MADLIVGFAKRETVERVSGERREPAWLFKNRLDALRKFTKLGLEEHPLFKKYTSLGTALVSDMEPYMSPPVPPVVTSCEDDAVAGSFHQEENTVHQLYLKTEFKSNGVMLDTLQNVAANRPHLMKDAVIEHSTLPEKDKLAQLTRALWTSGVYINIPDGVSLQQPIVLRWSVGKEKMANLTRTFIILGRGSKATMIEEIEISGIANGSGQSMFTGTTEVVLGKGAKLGFNSLVDAGGSTATFLNRYANVGEGSKVMWALGYTGGLLTKSRIDNLLAGRGAAVNEVEALYGHKSQTFDLTSVTRHIAEDTESDMLTKGVIQDQARVNTKGLITIEKGGKGSDSYLGEFGMSLNRDARFLAIPSLEIENHAVRRAKHASSVSQIDENQVYYLMTRGIEEREARKLIVMGFLEPVVQRIPLDSVADKVRNSFERKWAG